MIRTSLMLAAVGVVLAVIPIWTAVVAQVEACIGTAGPLVVSIMTAVALLKDT